VPRTGSLTIQLPPVIAARPEPHHLLIWVQIANDDPVLIVNDYVLSSRFPLTLTAVDINSLPTMPRQLRGDGEERFIIQFLNEYEEPIWWSDPIFTFDD
jgi:hypothetical protein